MLFESSGFLVYSNNPYKLIVQVEPDIASFYRSLIPKYIPINKQRYPPHISIVRNEVPINLNKWESSKFEPVRFFYDNYINIGNVYAWINVYSDDLIKIRVELGLSKTTVKTRPPDRKECFHITIGNFKDAT